MTYQKSFADHKVNISRNLYFFSIKQHLGITGIYSLLLLLAMPISTALMLMSQMQNNNATSNIHIQSPVSSLIYICGVMCIVLSTMLFHYMHSKKTVDMYHSLPIERTALLLARYFAGLTMLIVPVVVMSVLTWIITFSFGLHSGDSSIQLFQVVCIIILALIGIFSFATFIAVNTGTTFDFLAVFIAINIAWPILINVLQQLFSSMLQGYAGKMSVGVYSLFSPGYRLLYVTNTYNDLFSYIYLPIFSVVMLTGAFLLYKRRKSEAVSSAFAYSYMQILIKTVISTAIGISFGFGFSSSFSIGSQPVQVNIPVIIASFSCGFLIGSFVAFIIIHVVVSRGFKGFGRSLITYGVLAVAFGIFYCALGFDLIGFSTRVPAQSSILSVETNYHSQNAGYMSNFYQNPTVDDSNVKSEISSTSSIYYSSVNQYSPDNSTNTYKDPQSIKAFYFLQMDIVHEIKQKPNPHFTMHSNNQIGYGTTESYVNNNYPSDYSSPTETIDITFHLKDGLSVHRAYTIGTATFKQELDVIQNLTEYKKFTNIAFHVNPDVFNSADLTGTYRGQRQVYVTTKQSKEIITAYRADILETNTKNPASSPLGTIELNCDKNGTIQIPVYPNYSNLLKTLADNSMDDIFIIPKGTTALLCRYIPPFSTAEEAQNIIFASRLDLSFSPISDINKIKELLNVDTKFQSGVMSDGFFIQYYYPDGTHSTLIYVSGLKTPDFECGLTFRTYTSDELAQLGIHG